MERHLRLFAVLSAAIAITQCQPTVTQTDADLDDSCDASEKEVSAFSTETKEQMLIDRYEQGELRETLAYLRDRTDRLETRLTEMREDIDDTRRTTMQLQETISRIEAERIVYNSCKQIRDANSSSASGQYTIHTVTGRILDKVYCEMGLNGGGYTFLNPQDLPSLTNDEVQAMFTDKNSFLMRVRRSDNTQPHGVLTQLPQYQSIPLKLGLNEYSDYAAPQNLGYLGPNFLYVGFIPASQARSRTQQGLQVNGRAMTFTNCDANPNSYMALFPNFAERNPTTYGRDVRFQFCINLFNSLTVNPSRRLMPSDYFVFLETHWGGCGCYTQTDGSVSVSGTLNAAIGFR